MRRLNSSSMSRTFHVSSGRLVFKVVVTVHVNEVEFHIASVVFLLHKEIIQLGTRFFTDVPPDNEGLFPGWICSLHHREATYRVDVLYSEPKKVGERFNQIHLRQSALACTRGGHFQLVAKRIFKLFYD